MFTFSQSQYSYLSFQTFKGTLKMLQITICPQIQQEKSLKWPQTLNRLGYSAKIFWISFSQWDYQMVNTSKILKFLTRNGFDEFGWNNPSIFLFPWLKALRVLTCFFKGEQSSSLKDSFVMSKASSEDISVSYVILCMIRSGSNYEGNVWIHLMWLHQSSHSVKWQESSQSHSSHQNSRVKEQE